MTTPIENPRGPSSHTDKNRGRLRNGCRGITKRKEAKLRARGNLVGVRPNMTAPALRFLGETSQTVVSSSEDLQPSPTQPSRDSPPFLHPIWATTDRVPSSQQIPPATTTATETATATTTITTHFLLNISSSPIEVTVSFKGEMSEDLLMNWVLHVNRAANEVDVVCCPIFPFPLQTLPAMSMGSQDPPTNQPIFYPTGPTEPYPYQHCADAPPLPGPGTVSYIPTEGIESLVFLGNQHLENQPPPETFYNTSTIEPDTYQPLANQPTLPERTPLPTGPVESHTSQLFSNLPTEGIESQTSQLVYQHLENQPPPPLQSFNVPMHPIETPTCQPPLVQSLSSPAWPIEAHTYQQFMNDAVGKGHVGKKVRGSGKKDNLGYKIILYLLFRAAIEKNRGVKFSKFRKAKVLQIENRSTVYNFINNSRALFGLPVIENPPTSPDYFKPCKHQKYQWIILKTDMLIPICSFEEMVKEVAGARSMTVGAVRKELEGHAGLVDFCTKLGFENKKESKKQLVIRQALVTEAFMRQKDIREKDLSGNRS